MTTDKRNTQVVACLIAAMTAGAALLLWLEPPVNGWSESTLLMAETVPAIAEVRVEFVQPLTHENLQNYDCILLPDGQCDWRPQGGEKLRLAVVGIPDEEMSEEQSRTLLQVFGSMTQRHALSLKNVWLDPASDARLYPDLAAGAHSLTNLLVRKGLIQ
jgi:hypothetical protein